MHWVDRGPEPEGLAAVRSRYTPRWVEYYRNGTGSRPSDSHWRDFHDDLSSVFFDLCAYCEELCRGEVEHFRPKSRFPELVYEWSNWVFACHDCNFAKSEKWPTGGYIDPCARLRAARPQTFFGFDTLTGEIVPKTGLSLGRRKKAVQIIDDLQLNARHHTIGRIARIREVSLILSHGLHVIPHFRDRLAELAHRNTELSSVARFMLEQYGYP